MLMERAPCLGMLSKSLPGKTSSKNGLGRAGSTLCRGWVSFLQHSQPFPPHVLYLLLACR